MLIFAALQLISFLLHWFSSGNRDYSENWEKQYFSKVNDIKENAREQVKSIIHENDISKLTIKNIIENLNKEKESEYIIFYRSVNDIHKEARCHWFEKNKKLLITVRNIEKSWKREQESKQKIMEALETAKEANRAKSDFLSRMSHDIRTPLNAIMGMTAIAKKYSGDTAKVESCLDSILNSSNYLTLLINDVLDMAKIENNKLKLNEEVFSLEEVAPLINSKVGIILSLDEKYHLDVIGNLNRYNINNVFFPFTGCILHNIQFFFICTQPIKWRTDRCKTLGVCFEG